MRKLPPRQHSDQLSLTFAALADPTRRAIIAGLITGERTVTELAEPHAMSLPAISKHLRVLERSGLIERTRAAQWRPCRLKAAPMKAAVDWLEDYRRHWEASLDRLDDYLRKLQSKEKNHVTKKNKSKTEPASRVLEITRLLPAPRHLVFEAWTQKEHLSQWCAPKGFTIPFSEGDLRRGGKWRSCMRMPDGTECWLSGVYRNIVQDECVEFTHAWEENGKRGRKTVVTVRLSDYGRKTKMILRQSLFESVASRNGHKDGWSQCLDRLASHLKQI